MQGLYYAPRFSEILQEYEPSPNEIAHAIARKKRRFIVPALSRFATRAMFPLRTIVVSVPLSTHEKKVWKNEMRLDLHQLTDKTNHP